MRNKLDLVQLEQHRQINGRKSGKTTAMLVDAIVKAATGDDGTAVLVLGRVLDHADGLMIQAKEILPEVGIASDRYTIARTNRTITFAGGCCLRFVSVEQMRTHKLDGTNIAREKSGIPGPSIYWDHMTLESLARDIEGAAGFWR